MKCERIKEELIMGEKRIENLKILLEIRNFKTFTFMFWYGVSERKERMETN